MSKGSAIYNPDVQSDIDMKNQFKLINYQSSSTALLSVSQTIYVDAVNGTPQGQRGTTASFQNLTQALAVAQAGDTIELRPWSYTETTSHSISVNNLTIRGNGAKLVYTNGGTVSLSIVASSVTVLDLEINGGDTSSDADNGIIEVTGSNCRFERLYVHNGHGYGIRGLTSFSNLSIINCRFESCNTAITTAIGANINNILVMGCTAQNNRNGGIHIRNSNVGTYLLKQVKIIGNTLITNNASGSTSVENLLLFGGDDDIVVTDNYVSGNYFPISLDHCRRGVCNSNTIKGGAYCGIEGAGCQNLVISGNYIDGRDETGTSVGGYGIVISNTYASSDDAGPFILSNNLITNLLAQPAIQVNAANDILILGNSCRDSAINQGGLYIKECFRARVIGNSFVTSSNAGGNINLDAGSRTVGGKGLQDIEILNNVFDQTGGSQIITITDSQVKGVNRVVISGNIVPAAGTFSAGYVNDTASTVGLVIERNIPQGTPGFQDGWHNKQTVENLTLPGTGTFSIGSSGILLASSYYKIGFDSVGGTKGYVRYNVDTADANHGHIFSAGTPGSQTDVFSIFGNSTAKVGANTIETQNNKGVASGYASLDGSGKVPAGQLPTLSSGTIATTLSPLVGDNAGNAIADSAPSGTGHVVRATSPTLVTPTIGVATATSINGLTITASTGTITVPNGVTATAPEVSTLLGFRHIPQNSQSAAYTTVLTDSGKEIYHPVGDNNPRTFTIDSNANVAYPIGTVILFTNMAPAALSVAITSDTLTLLGSGLTGTRTVAQYGSMLAKKDTTTSWNATPIANVT